MAESTKRPAVNVIGAGLAGCEAAYQLAQLGIPVKLFEMKPLFMSPAHHSADFAELVCSNSLRSNQSENAVGLLKEELRSFNSLILACADRNAVPAGGALAVDREAFSAEVSRIIREHPLIEVIAQRIERLADVYSAGNYCIVASGPLTDPQLLADIQLFVGQESLHFFDAAAPLIEADSIDFRVAFKQSRYDKGSADYINCPMTEEEYSAFHQALVNAELAEVKDFDKVFEGCMPIEVLAKRGADAIRYGMMKPVGLRDPRTGKRPYAVVQLRQDNAAASLYNLVGFQTRLKFPEQRRVFRMIPGLENAVFARYGVMHRNSFLKAPLLLAKDYSLKQSPTLFFAGQISGVEGYVESTASGLVAARNVASQYFSGKSNFILPRSSMMGAMQHYIAEAEAENFQPMNANFGILPALQTEVKKAQRKAAIVDRARQELEVFKANYQEPKAL